MTRVLIIKLSSLGDLFHALPAVHALKVGLHAEIDWVTQPEYTDLVDCFDDVSKIWSFPRKKLKSKLIPFLKDIREQNYDYIIDLQGLLKSAIILAGAKGERKIGPSFSREGANLLYPEIAGLKDKERHAVDELFDVVRHLNLPTPEQIEFPVSFPKMELSGTGIQIAFAPFSRAEGKNWPAERFIKLGQQIAATHECTLHLVGGPGERSECERMATEIGPAAISHAGKTTLLELGGMLKEMDLLITVDSGPMHMAAAVGTPTLALFGPTSPLRTGPYGKQHAVIESDFNPEEKKISKKQRHTDMRFIEALSTEQVLKAANELIERIGNNA